MALACLVIAAQRRESVYDAVLAKAKGRHGACVPKPQMPSLSGSQTNVFDDTDGFPWIVDLVPIDRIRSFRPAFLRVRLRSQMLILTVPRTAGKRVEMAE